ncbi:MAG: hypothetical protein QM308_07910 [Bacillota bacterium]|nr:hypothetical protein [Bacillota bacterium]
MKHLRRLLPLFLVFLLIMPASADVALAPGSYLYSPYQDAVASVPAYEHHRSIYLKDLRGAESLANLKDAWVADDRIFVLRDGELLILDLNFNLVRSIRTYLDKEGKEHRLSGGNGIAVCKDGDYYIARSIQGDILHFSSDHKLVRVIGRPRIPGFENVAYKPIKLAVDEAKRIYVVAQGMYEGIVELSPDGEFSRFYGVNRVKFSFAQFFWRIFATREQLQRQQLWLPTDFTNLCIDSRGFIFATIQDSQGEIIKRLNAKGENILRPIEGNYPEGDVLFNPSGVGIPTGPSAFIAVDSNPYGVFIALDQKRNRIFAYNEDGRPLYIIGGPGQHEGLFRNPVDLDFVGEYIMVLDALSQSIDIYAPTAYGQAIHNAVRQQYVFNYEEAAKHWRRTLDFNHNFTLAYSGIGRSLLRAGQYDQAMEYLRMGSDREYYSKAFEKVRDRELKIWLMPVLLGLIVLSALVKIFKWQRKKRSGKGEAHT